MSKHILESKMYFIDENDDVVNSQLRNRKRQLNDESVIITKDPEIESESTNKMYLSQYIALKEDVEIKYEFDLYIFLKEVLLIAIINFILFYFNSSSSFDVITIDGILTSIIFYLSYIENNDNFLAKDRLATGDRYIYFFLIMIAYSLFSFGCLKIGFTILIILAQFIGIIIKSILIVPSIMKHVYNHEGYKNIKKHFYEKYNNLVQKIVCKQMSKIINLCIRNILKIDFIITKDDIIPFYDQFSIAIIIRFIATFIFACLFNHMDKGGWKIPMIFYKNMYLKDKNYKITDDKEYLIAIVKDKNWGKFLDIYTLNRLIRLLMNDDDPNNGFLAEQVTQFITSFLFSFNKVMFCWTIMCCTQELYVGILSQLLFLKSSKHRFKYILNTLLFTFLAFYELVQGEKILVILICEIMYLIVNSKIIVDILSDIYSNIKKIFAYIAEKLNSIGIN